MTVEQFGLCIVSDSYFSDFPHIRHMDNKHESRPYFLAIREKTGITWLVPLSSQTEKYRAKMALDESRYGESVFHYIATVAGHERAVLIGNCIPVTDDYIVRPYSIRGVPYVIADSDICRKILSKLRRYLALVRRGKLSPTVNILDIERILISRIANSSYIV